MVNLLSVDFSTEWDQVVTLLYNSNFDNLKLFLLRYAFQVVVYHIWREHNQRRHGEAPSSPSRIVKLIDKNIQNRLSSIHTARDITYNDAMVLWFASQPP